MNQNNNQDELYHYGVLGMKWGHRRAKTLSSNVKLKRQPHSDDKKNMNKNTSEAKAARRKKALKVGAAVVGTALVAYGAYKISKAVKTKQYERGVEVYKKMRFEEADRLFQAAKKDLNEAAERNIPIIGMRGGKYGQYDFTRNIKGETTLTYKDYGNKISYDDIRKLGKRRK